MCRLHKDVGNGHEAFVRFPKPKAPAGAFLYAVSAIALLFSGRVLWVVGGQNIENLSAEKGYDKLLSQHWSEIMEWLAVNGFWLCLVTAMFIGGALALWANFAIQSAFGNRDQPAPIGVKTAPNSAVTPVYTPVALPPAPPKFSYPYPKAVLVAAFPAPSGSADSDGMIDMSAVIAVENRHNGPLNDCHVFVVSIAEGNNKTDINVELRSGKDRATNKPIGKFNLNKDGSKRWVFIHRDMKDKISNPPYLMRLITGDRVLNDNTQYVIAMELRSEYEHPTKVGIQVDIGVGKDIKITLLDQSV